MDKVIFRGQNRVCRLIGTGSLIYWLNVATDILIGQLNVATDILIYRLNVAILAFFQTTANIPPIIFVVEVEIINH